VLAREPMVLSPGIRFTLDLAREAMLLDRVQTRLVSLRLRRVPEVGPPMRQYALKDGTLLRQASSDSGESRREMMLALLGRMGRVDAAPEMAALTTEGSDHLRWQALRECIALDSGTGFAALCNIARNPADELAAPAGALRARLLEAYPALATLEVSLCPA
jgi:hypothetical protein